MSIRKFTISCVLLFSCLQACAQPETSIKQNFVNMLLEHYIGTIAPKKLEHNVGGYFTNWVCNRTNLGHGKWIQLPTGIFRHGLPQATIAIKQSNGKNFDIVDTISYDQLGVQQLYSVTQFAGNHDVLFFADRGRIVAFNIKTKQKIFNIRVEQPENTKQIIKVEPQDGRSCPSQIFKYQFKNKFTEEEHTANPRIYSSKIAVTFPVDITRLMEDLAMLHNKPLTADQIQALEAITRALQKNKAIQVSSSLFNGLPTSVQSLLAQTKLVLVRGKPAVDPVKKINIKKWLGIGAGCAVGGLALAYVLRRI